MMKHVEQIFETALWNSRFVVLLAVISSLFTAFAMFYMATVDTFYTIQHLAHYASPELIYLSGGIALIGLALYLTHQSEGH